MAQILGGAVACILLGLLIGLSLKSEPPFKRAALAAGGSWVLAGILAGFGMADGGSFRYDAILIYLPSAVLAFFYLRWHYNKSWVAQDH